MDLYSYAVHRCKAETNMMGSEGYSPKRSTSPGSQKVSKGNGRANQRGGSAKRLPSHIAESQ